MVKDNTKFISFASSSNANTEFISFNGINIIIDCGISINGLQESLKKYNLTIDDINYLFITHKHSDHIKSLSQLLKKYNIKIYGAYNTLLDLYKEYKKNDVKDAIDVKNFFPLKIKKDKKSFVPIEICENFKVVPFFSYHDVETVFYKFYIKDNVFAILTDCGKYDNYILDAISDVNFLMLECNYDLEWLINKSGYPDFLINRIKSTKGHLSNEDCAKIIYELSNKNLKKVFLSHISKNSNSEEYAYQFVTNYLNSHYNIKSLPEIYIARRDIITEIYNDNS